MNRPAATKPAYSPKYKPVADLVRAMIADNLLPPGEAAPSSAALARMTGQSLYTCRRALRVLVSDGVLIAGASANARPRVPSPVSKPGDGAAARAARDLSESLAARRRALGLKQTDLAARIGVSTTTVGHAETGRLWQSRPFWEHADKALDAGGELLALHDAYRARAVSGHAGGIASDTQPSDPPPMIVLFFSGPVAGVSITWADGKATTVRPPGQMDQPTE